MPADPHAMAAILIVAHAPLASTLAAVAAHVYPDCGSRLVALDVAPQASIDEVEAQLRALISLRPEAEVLMLTDVFGATPSNAAMRVADGVRARLVTGANVPMVWRSLCYADEPLERLVTRAVEGATQGVLQLSSPRRQNQGAPSSSSHDQVEHHDQQ
jgi:PTS system ascorbate-specific IIA component